MSEIFDSFDTCVNAVLAFAVLVVIIWKLLSTWSYANGGRGSRAAKSCQASNGGHSSPAQKVIEPEIEESEQEIGEDIELDVETLHFGLPRCRIQYQDMEPLSKMIKWAPEEFDAFQLEVARVRMGTFRCWVIQGMRSNRLLYAMKKRGDVHTARCITVPPPEPRPEDEDDENERTDTYGPDFTKIQLIPR
eukprot:TRINITY_DN58958_c0_g1_i1.p1 TRINITY_DN58958_c0_g1~~TRINITY_DN58958_c0_g1_i1.p1  ORF type:complete len:191 (+),score=25.39 TRINITY_DN58958_c0_g1_i1:79-651(+)